MSAVGDINAHAFIYDQAGGDADGTHNQWEVNGGVLQTPAIFKTNVLSNDGNWYQTLGPLDVSASPSFFLVDAITVANVGAGGNVLYREAPGAPQEVQPSAIYRYVGSWQDYFGPKNWGNYSTTGCAAFWFKGKAYCATLTQSWAVSLFSIIDATPEHNYAYVEIVEDGLNISGLNGNATAGACYEVTPGGESVRVYTLFTGESVKCYEVTL
jgi:hypothetical protein